VFTRMRYCSPRGRIAFEEKGPPGTQQPGLYPWYAVPGRVERGLKVACGHWSSLGLFIGHGVHALDTGAVWGGRLTALRLDCDGLEVVQGPGRQAAGPGPGSRGSGRGAPAVLHELEREGVPVVGRMRPARYLAPLPGVERRKERIGALDHRVDVRD